jgi:hypothetical protein
MTTLESLDRLLEKATPGPWDVGSACEQNYIYGTGPKGWAHLACIAGHSDRPEDMALDQEQGEANAALIVAAVNALPSLIKRIRDLEEGLRPFGSFLDALDNMGRTTPRSGTIYSMISSVSGEREINVEDFRKARALLSETPDEWGQGSPHE